MITRIHKIAIMHRVVKHRGTVYIGGVTASDNELDIAGQTAQACQTLEKLLAEAGSDKNRLLSVTIYLTDIRLKGQMNEAWLEWLTDKDLPARATVEVSSLAPGKLIEIVSTAAANDEQ